MHATAIRVKACPSPGAPGPRGARSAASKWGSDPAHQPGSVDTRSVWLIIARRRAAPRPLAVYHGTTTGESGSNMAKRYPNVLTLRTHRHSPLRRGNPSDLPEPRPAWLLPVMGK